MSLEAVDLSCGYADTPVLCDIRFSLQPGELVCLLGPNGVGKTTLFRTLLGLLRPLKGTVLMDGANLHAIPAVLRARSIAYVPQIGAVTFPYTAGEVALMGRAPWLRLHQTPTRRDRATVDDVFETLALMPLLRKPFTQLSSGEKQLVLIARALVQTPRYLVLDEPMSNLDFGNQALVLARVQQLKARGLGIILTTHHPNHAFDANGRVLLIDRTRRIHAGDVKTVMTPANLLAAYGVHVAVLSRQLRPGIESHYCVSVGGDDNS